MAQTIFPFPTNIEHRMPQTGRVFFVNRMTSDYAQQHPFDVEAFLDDVYTRWQQQDNMPEARETREALRHQWERTLAVTSPRGNAAIYPNKNGQRHPALMEVWAKAAEYWRHGLRPSDTLPAIAPATKITRLADGSWIALFPKDAHLLSERTEQTETTEAPTSESAEPMFTQAEVEAMIAQRIAECEAELQAEAELLALACQPSDTETTMPSVCPAVLPQEAGETQSTTHRRRRTTRSAERTERTLSEESAAEANSSLFTIHSSLLKPLGLAAAACLALFVIWNTGLLIPLGLIGLATGGILK